MSPSFWANVGLEMILKQVTHGMRFSWDYPKKTSNLVFEPKKMDLSIGVNPPNYKGWTSHSKPAHSDQSYIQSSCPPYKYFTTN